MQVDIAEIEVGEAGAAVYGNGPFEKIQRTLVFAGVDAIKGRPRDAQMSQLARVDFLAGG